MARMRLSPFGEGRVFPHEHTHGGPKMDRMMLTALCKANLSQVFGLYPDPQCEAQDVLEETIAGQTPVEAVDHLGVIHRMWPVTDVSVISRVTGLMGPKPVFIADGHHRYETACHYRDQVYDSGFLSPDHPANYVLTALVAMEDPGLIVLPCHRLVQRIEQSGRQDVLGLYAAADARWVLAELTPAGKARMDEAAKNHHEPWRRLGVSILHELVFKELLGWKDSPELQYVQTPEQVAEALRQRRCTLAALVMPATVSDIREVSLTGERLPPKSTYFYPKLLSGLVINPLE